VLGVFGLYSYIDNKPNFVQAKDVSGIINKSEVWTGNIVIMGDVIIKDNATVTIQGGTIVVFNKDIYKIQVIDDAQLLATGTPQSPIWFKANISRWNSIEIFDNARGNFEFCHFNNSNNGITLINNSFKTYMGNCTFTGTKTSYLNLTSSRLDVVNTKFENAAFDNKNNLSSNLKKIKINDEWSEIFFEHYVEVNTIDGNQDNLPNINVSIRPIGGINRTRTYQGKTGMNGIFNEGLATTLRAFGKSPNVKPDFNYIYSVEVWDKWDGTGKAESNISRQSIDLNNVSSYTKLPNLNIPLLFTFNYPPRIDTEFPSKIIVKEGVAKLREFTFHDNDDFLTGTQHSSQQFDNITIKIRDKNGKNIYDGGGIESTKENWVSWSTQNGGELKFYRTIESPFTPADPNDYKAIVNELINITIKDDDDNEATSWCNIEYHNIPDKPSILGLPSNIYVTEDQLDYLPITIVDDDNATSEISISSSNKYVSYQYNQTEDQGVLVFDFKNDFGIDGEQEEVILLVTDNCWYYDEGKYIKSESKSTFNVYFNQAPDPPTIIGQIPDKVGNESNWLPELALDNYWSDPDPDDTVETLKWYVTGVDESVFDVTGDLVWADTPLAFNLKSNLDLGGAHEPMTINNDVTIWLRDKDGLKDSQEIRLRVSSTNLQPSMQKVEFGGGLISVEPKWGDTKTDYRFLISYKDQDGLTGDPPEYVRVVIDNVSYDMNETDPGDSDYTDGKEYYYETKLPLGKHEHYFICSDGELKARHPKKPATIKSPEVVSKSYISEFRSSDETFIARIEFSGLNGNLSITPTTDPNIQHKTHKGDWGAYFKMNPQNIQSLFWIEVTVLFGEDYQNYESKWLRKEDMQLAFLKNNEWIPIISSNMVEEEYLLRCNITPEPAYGYDILFEDILSGTRTPAFTVIGWLDGDGDGYFNDEDAFPLDPSAKEDRDGDGSPAENEWIPNKGPKDSTSDPPLHEDKFPDDPAASLDNDKDGCPDKWNPGKSAANSTSEPPLVLDHWPNNPGACADTDGDNLPDMILSGNTDPTLKEDPDDDNDGMLDYWELDMNDIAEERGLEYRFDPKDPSDGALDWDGDGRNNTEEYKDGTDPFTSDTPEDEKDFVLSSETALLVGIIIVFIIIIILFMYTKLRRDQLLEHKVRAQILDHINNNPGIHYRKILNDLDLQMGVLTHHLNMLERQKYIKSLQDSMYRRFYPLNAPIKKDLILSDVQESILELIRAEPGISQADIARKLNLAKKVVNYHIKILTDAGFVQMEMAGRSSKCYYLDGLDMGKGPIRFKPRRPPQAG
jgi:DNA-binding MarR family transcriptional regulator